MKQKITKLLCALLALATLASAMTFTAFAGGDGPDEDEGFLLYAEDRFALSGNTVVSGSIVKGTVKVGDAVELRTWDDSTKEVRPADATVVRIVMSNHGVDEASAGSAVGLELSGISVSDVHIGDAVVSKNSPLVTTSYAFEGTLSVDGVDSSYYNVPTAGTRNFFWAGDVNAQISAIPDKWTVDKGETAEGVIVSTAHPVTWYVGQTISVRNSGLTIGTFTVTCIGKPIFNTRVNGIGRPTGGRTPAEVASPEVEDGAGGEKEFSVALGWYDHTTGLFMEENDTFRAGDVYFCMINYRANDGYFFFRGCDHMINGSGNRISGASLLTPYLVEGNFRLETATESFENLESLGNLVYWFDFNEKTQFDGWTCEDEDEDGSGWHHWFDDPDSSLIGYNYGIDGAIMSRSYDSEKNVALTPENWTYSPDLLLPNGRVRLSFRAASWDYDNNYAETVAVYVRSVDDPARIEVMKATPVYGDVSDHGYVTYVVDLSAFRDQAVNVAFRHIGFGKNALFIDDVKVYFDDRLPCDGADGCPGKNFTDMPPKDNWAHDPIDWAIVFDITKGTSPTTFSPDDGCTRAQAVTFLWRAAGCPEPYAADNPFSDVNGDDYFYKAVLWAVGKGITKGTSPTAFSPDETCTRAQITTFLWRLRGEAEPISPASHFTDVTESDYFYKAVLWAADNGVTKGTTETEFSPDDTCTRAQIVAFLYRCFFL